MAQYIHDLVGKMTMREKGYFKTIAFMQGSNQKNYLQLYAYVEETPIYNTKDVLNKFKGSPIGKYLSSEYNYLADQLLKSLVNFHFNKSDINKIQKSTLFINMLIEKNLKAKALKVLRHTKKIAYKNEFFTQILTLIDLEEELLFRQGILGFTKNLKNLELERQGLIKKIDNFNALRLLREQIRELWFQEGYLVNGDHPIITAPILETEKNALSVRAKEHWYYIVAMKDFILQNHEQAIFKFKKAIDFVESFGHLFKTDNLLVLISNYLYNCALAKDAISFEIVLNKLNTLETTRYTKYIKYSRSLELHYQLYDLEKSYSLENEVYPFIKKYNHQLELTQSNYIYFLITRNAIIIGNFEKAHDYLNQWLQLKIIDYYYLYIKLFTLIIYFELKYDALLSSEISTSYKVLKGHKQLNSTAKKMILFFKYYLRKPDRELTLLKQLEMDLFTNNKNPETENNYKYFDYLIWVKNRIQRSSKK